jgi:N-acetylglutamate synthase-like GNAT family acetyltransferase
MSALFSNCAVRIATAADWPQVAQLLSAAQLPLDGAQEHLADFVLALRDGQLVGCAGLERYGKAALLRSVAVRAEARSSGVGRALVNAVLAQARVAGVRQIVLLTETARGYFPRFGFREISRAEAPEAVQASAEFTTACPQSATVMALDYG